MILTIVTQNICHRGHNLFLHIIVAGDNSYKKNIPVLFTLICLSDHEVAYFCGLIDRSTSNANSSIIFSNEGSDMWPKYTCGTKIEEKLKN
jgi:hypothetical protein